MGALGTIVYRCEQCVQVLTVRAMYTMRALGVSGLRLSVQWIIIIIIKKQLTGTMRNGKDDYYEHD